jgi:hypothetical protein
MPLPEEVTIFVILFAPPGRRAFEQQQLFW